VLEVTVYESLKKGKRKTSQFFFVGSSICFFTARNIWLSRETQHAVHSQKLCVNAATSHCLGNPGFESWQGQEIFSFAKCPDHLWGPAVSNSIGSGGSFPRCKVVEVCFHGAHMEKKHFLLKDYTFTKILHSNEQP